MKFELGKRFLFATVSVICISITSILLKYGGEIYFKLITAICGLFIAGQTITDYKQNGVTK